MFHAFPLHRCDNWAVTALSVACTQQWTNRVLFVQIPEHLECPDTLPDSRFYNMPADLKKFYNCARTWCAQAGVLDRNTMDESVDAGAKHVKKLTVLLNRLLGMNLQQQQIVFGYAFFLLCIRNLCYVLTAAC